MWYICRQCNQVWNMLNIVKTTSRFNKITAWEVREKRADIAASPDSHLHLGWAIRRDLMSTYREWYGCTVACLAYVSTAIINNRGYALTHDHSSLPACHSETSLLTQISRFDTGPISLTKFTYISFFLFGLGLGWYWVMTLSSLYAQCYGGNK